ncbi:uncharacterized protein RCC_09036 [Ramularia collo-cygni]|uniref:ubiquitinyl hydrolase 1 n=1 Tax=Ramularia collo-cygni TaxID=112498 RepID=A0A2D3VLD3_9PEZI|nr:uncharacterized protein RCC_09036 [Ramularia collo-cygni]CZT23324.1 uncharacterized protein RCC_09036 [Ramularia collo-cygni]
MGIRGVAIREIPALDENWMYGLPLPVHGLIFLFQYTDADHSIDDAGKHAENVWFANQVPEFACASVALLNLVNNIPHLDLGRELRDFKEFTRDMDPLMRGDTIDSFDFVKRIHNSFARMTDMLSADMVTKDKVQRAKKDASQKKARETKEANKAEMVEKGRLQEVSTDVTKLATNSTGRLRRPTARQADMHAKTSTPDGKRVTNVESSPSDISEDSDPGFKSRSKANTQVLMPVEPPRRSTRAPQPRKVVTAADYEEPDAGFHYVAYVPVGDHVWKLDGMNRYPQDLGSFKVGGNGADGGTGDWLDVVTPMIKSRMNSNPSAWYNLMAVVRDPFFDEQRKLLENVKKLQAVDLKLQSLDDDWRSMEGGETRKDVISGISIEFGISEKDIDDAELPPSAEDFIASEDDLITLIDYRQSILKEQTMLRSGLRDALQAPDEGEDDARLRKHDYGPFIRGWLSALAERGVLHDLLD